MTGTNTHQYQITKVQLARFEQAIEAAERDRLEPGSAQDADAYPFLLKQAREQADGLRQELEEYEAMAGSQT